MVGRWCGCWDWLRGWCRCPLRSVHSHESVYVIGSDPLWVLVVGYVSVVYRCILWLHGLIALLFGWSFQVGLFVGVVAFPLCVV